MINQHHVVEGCSQCMVGWQVEAGQGREEGRSVGRPDASNVRFVRNCAAAEGGREARQQPAAASQANRGGRSGMRCKQEAA